MSKLPFLAPLTCGLLLCGVVLLCVVCCVLCFLFPFAWVSENNDVFVFVFVLVQVGKGR